MASVITDTVNDRIRRATETTLDVYERGVRAYADVHERTGQASHVAWVQDLTRLQADVLRETASVYATSARELLR